MAVFCIRCQASSPEGWSRGCYYCGVGAGPSPASAGPPEVVWRVVACFYCGRDVSIRDAIPISFEGTGAAEYLPRLNAYSCGCRAPDPGDAG